MKQSRQHAFHNMPTSFSTYIFHKKTIAEIKIRTTFDN